MNWQVYCENYEVRSNPEVKTSKNGNSYAQMRLENTYGYSDNIICRDAATLINANLKKGDVISFDAVVSIGRDVHYPGISIPKDARIQKNGK